jgi:hypothetical protein
MKISKSTITEATIRNLIESTVRRMLKEDDKKLFSVEQVRNALRNEMVNIAEIARDVFVDKIQTKSDEDTYRSLLSNFSLGNKELSDEYIQKIGIALQKKGYNF